MVVRYSIVPVGHGFMSLMTMDDTVVLTDGGTMKTRLSFRLAQHNFMTALKTQGVEVDKASWKWIISHIDYDHVSVASWYFDSMDLTVDECYLPGVLAISACREAVAYFMALQYLFAYELELISNLPKKSEVVVWVFRRCRKKKAAVQGRNINFNSVIYHVIWPSTRRASEKCKRLIEAIINLIEEYCKMRYESAEHVSECLEKFKRHLEEMKPSFSDIERYYDAGQCPDHASVVSEINADGRRGYLTSRRFLRSRRTYLAHFQLSNEIRRLLSRRGLVHLADLYNILKAEYTDLTALAYAVIYGNDPADVTFDFYSNINNILFQSKLLFHTNSPVKLLYLSDLKEWALREALNYHLSSVKLPNYKQPIVLVAPHHGTAWESELMQLTPYITVILSRFMQYVKIEKYIDLTKLTTVATGLQMGVTVAF